MVDGADRVVGVAQRGQLLSRGLGFRTAHVLVVDGDRMMLQHLGALHSRHPGQWGSSAAGYLHAGESYEQGAQRRLLEETGLDLDLEPVGVTSMMDGRSTKFMGVFLARTAVEEAPVLEAEHVAEVEWVEVDALMNGLEGAPREYTKTFEAVIAFCVGKHLFHKNEV